MSAPDTTPRIVIAGVASGVGKTTIATGLMAAFVQRGLRVQAFKVGPDYIDPTFHRAATGRPSYNLDTWLVGEAAVRRRFDVSMRQAEAAVIEGVMGLFDGRKGTRDTASTAEIARLLDAPVALVVDVARMGQSAAAVVAGFQRLDPRVRLGGVILNRVASADHERTIRYALAEWTDVPTLGAIPREASLNLPSRQLGLIPAPETMLEMDTLAATITRYVDVEALLALASAAGALPTLSAPADAPHSEQAPTRGVNTLVERRMRLGLARDDAFSFYYPEALEAFAAFGIEVAPFSPLTDTELPAKIDALYFGGGYPEVFAAQLAANTPMLRAVHQAAATGMPIYAECGGLMYLGETCRDRENAAHTMVGALPTRTVMGEARAQLGYRSVEMLRDTLLGPTGARLRGHEFHWSHRTDAATDATAAYRIEEQPGRIEGFATETILASYVHIPLAAHPEALEWFVQRCITSRGARRSLPSGS